METWKGVGCDLTILGMLAKEELIVRVRTLEFCSIWIIALDDRVCWCRASIASSEVNKGRWILIPVVRAHAVLMTVLLKRLLFLIADMSLVCRGHPQFENAITRAGASFPAENFENRRSSPLPLWLFRPIS